MAHGADHPLYSGDFTVVQGATVSGYVIAYNNGNTLNLTDYTARGYVKYKYGNTGVLQTLNVAVDSGNPNQGHIDVIISAEDTANLPVGKFPYDIEVYKNSYVRRVTGGKITVTPEVTTE
jgi:hypothetical protein